MAGAGAGSKLERRGTGSVPLISMDENEYKNLPVIHRACWNGDVDEVARQGRTATAVSERDQFGGTPLHLAAMQGHLGVVRYLVKRGASPTAANNYGVTPLHDACDKGYIGVAKYLVSKGASLSAVDQVGRSAADCISGARKIEILEQLKQVEERYMHRCESKKEKSFWVPLLSIVCFMVITFYLVSQFTT